MTVHLPLASYACVFRRARPSSLVGRDERRAPLKTPVWEANLPRDSVKFCVIFKDFVWATWGSDMKIVIEFARKVFYSSEKSGNLTIFWHSCKMAARHTKCSISMILRKNRGLWTVYNLPSTLDILPSTLDNIPSTVDILPSTLDKNLHSKSTCFLKLTYQQRVIEVQRFLKRTNSRPQSRFLVTWSWNEGLWRQPLPDVRKFRTSGHACAEVTNITAHAYNGFLFLTAPLGTKFYFLSSLQTVASLGCFENTDFTQLGFIDNLESKGEDINKNQLNTPLGVQNWDN